MHVQSALLAKMDHVLPPSSLSYRTINVCFIALTLGNGHTVPQNVSFL